VATITVLSDEGLRTIEGHLELGHVLVADADLEAAIGWSLKPEGLCRGEVCVPVRDPQALRVGRLVDLALVAAALDRPVVVDADEAVVAVGAARADRRRALRDLELPPITLPDLDGADHELEEWHGRRRLLVVFASW
jgi:hypothetical protein